MKFTVNRQVFLQKLKHVILAVTTKTPIPVLTGLKIEASGKGLTLTGSNAEISIESFIALTDEAANLKIESKGGTVLQPATLFSRIVTNLPGEVFTLEVKNEATAVIASKDAQFEIRVVNVSEYPKLPQMDMLHAFQLPVHILKEVIQQTIIAVSPHESRPILTGVQFTLKDGYLKAVATDSHRLSQRVVQLDQVNDLDYQIVIPGSSLKELVKILSDDTEEVTVAIVNNQILFQTEDTHFYSRLLEGNYPQTDQLFSDEWSTKITVDTPLLKGAVSRASILSHEGNNNVVSLTITSDRLQITGQSLDVGIVEEDIPFRAIEGEDLTISFNPDYLKEALDTFRGSQVTIQFQSPLRSFTLLPADGEKEDSFIQLITPIRTR